MEKYVPINCDYYDELEALATTGKQVRVVYQENGEQSEAHGIIKDLYTKESVEYMKLDNGFTLRLDKLVEVDGKLAPNVC
ncbi:MAG: hypothetical protein EOO04_14325 [Chitinophagaceae bacterium]|nr:MAG: hypothetical protein EOO04_14325 [Chitinophagaceae bacterium]